MIQCGIGNNFCQGGDGNDVVQIGISVGPIMPPVDADTIEFGDSTLDGGAGNDFLFAADGDDSILGGSGDDSIAGFSGNDTCDGGEGMDTAFTGAGNDLCIGGIGSDFLVGEEDNDMLFGGADGDFLSGGVGDDTSDGGTGDDILSAEGGNDSLIGGPGSDIFLYLYFGSIPVNADRIADFVPADDTVRLSATLGFATGAAALAAVSRVGANAVLTLPAGAGSITLVGVQAAALTSGDFVIV